MKTQPRTIQGLMTSIDLTMPTPEWLNALRTLTDILDSRKLHRSLPVLDPDGVVVPEHYVILIELETRKLNLPMVHARLSDVLFRLAHLFDEQFTNALGTFNWNRRIEVQFDETRPVSLTITTWWTLTKPAESPD